MNYSGKGLLTGEGDVLSLAKAWVGDFSAGAVRRQIAAKSMRGIELVPVLDVRCFLAHQKYVTAVHGKGETIITESLRDLEAEFADAFLRVHRNALVSVGFIEGFERPAPRRYQLRLAGVDRHIPVSRRHAPVVRHRIEALAGSKRCGEGLGQRSRRGPQTGDQLPLPAGSKLRPNGLSWRTAAHG